MVLLNERRRSLTDRHSGLRVGAGASTCARARHGKADEKKHNRQC